MRDLVNRGDGPYVTRCCIGSSVTMETEALPRPVRVTAALKNDPGEMGPSDWRRKQGYREGTSSSTSQMLATGAALHRRTGSRARESDRYRDQRIGLHRFWVSIQVNHRTCRFRRLTFDMSLESGMARSAWSGTASRHKPFEGRRAMRFMILIKSSPEMEAGVFPDPKVKAVLAKFSEELTKAGVMLGAEGLLPSVTGARVKFSGEKHTVIDGPFPETKELIAGFWLWEVKSKEEAIAWVKRCPNPPGADWEMEIRQVSRCQDHATDVAS
jgi:hypothetical protein